MFGKRKILMAGIVSCISILLFAGCREQNEEVEEQNYIGVACYNQADVFLNELLDCFKEECGKRDMIVTIRDAAGSQRTQNDQIQEMIGEGCDLLCVNLADRTDPSEIIDMVRENDVPVIFFNREPVMEDLMQWDKLYYVGADAKQSGIMQGELVAEMIQGQPSVDKNQDGKIQYVILEGESGHQDAIIRTETVVDTMKECGIALERLDYGIANWNRVQAKHRTIQMLEQYPKSIEVVLANNDEMALGAIVAYDELGYATEERPLFFGVDGTDAGLRSVKEGKLSATVYNDKEGQTKRMADLACALIERKGIETLEFERGRYVYLPYKKVTKENVDDFLSKKTESNP